MKPPRHLIALIVLTLLGGPPTPGADLFDPPQLAVSPSPAAATSLALGAGEAAIDTDVSPAGATVAAPSRRAAMGPATRSWPIASSSCPSGKAA